jgi:phosphopentomutase
LNAIGKSARLIADELQLSRVITRPFLGKTASDFKRTHHRKDLSQTPPRKTMMEFVIDAKLPTVGIGKIWNIFNGRGIQQSLETEDNADGLKVLEAALNTHKSGLLFVNLIDFDMLYGHRRDVPGFAMALEEFDAFIPTLEKKLTPDDLVIISADHGNDPTYRGTDHTREYIPLLAYRKGSKARKLGDRGSFADIGQTISHALTGKADSLGVGRSFLSEILA